MSVPVHVPCPFPTPVSVSGPLNYFLDLVLHTIKKTKSKKEKKKSFPVPGLKKNLPSGHAAGFGGVLRLPKLTKQKGGDRVRKNSED